MKKISKKNLIKIIVVAILVIVLLLFLSFRNKGIPASDLLNVCIEDECFMLKEELYVDVMDESPERLEMYVDGEEYVDAKYDESPIIYKDITIGSNVKDVFKAFNIKPGYAYINTEIDNALHDGTTDIEEFEFEDFDFLDREYLDAYIIFGYKKVNGKYVMVKASELEKYFEDEDNSNIDVIFGIDINGMSDEVVNIDEVETILITVLN